MKSTVPEHNFSTTEAESWKNSGDGGPLKGEYIDGKGQRPAEQTFLHDQCGARRKLDAGAEMAGGDEEVVPAGDRSQERQAGRAARTEPGPAAFELRPRQVRNQLVGQMQ